MKNIVIVGAGPVGLWTAIQMNKRFPDARITLYERYKSYQRKHVLKIQHSSLFFGASKRHNEHDQQFFRHVFAKSRKDIKQAPFKKSYISTNTIEQQLKSWVLGIGCNIVYRHIDSLDELIAEHNENTVFIIANGAHSNLRNLLLGEDDIEKTDFQYILELKSNVEKPVEELKSANANGSIKAKLHNLAFEYIGKTEQNITPVSLRLFVNEGLYNQTPDATFKSPITHPEFLPELIAKDVETYANLHGMCMKDLFKNGQVTKLQLSVYHAKKFGAAYQGHPFFLVGDAAMGVPYFRALNCGFVLASRLAFILKYRTDANKAISTYNRYQHVHRNAEEALARGKNNTLNTYNGLRKLYRLIKK